MTDRARYIARLRGLAKRLENRHEDMLMQGLNEAGIKQAGDILDDAHAVNWALRQLEARQEMEAAE